MAQKKRVARSASPKSANAKTRTKIAKKSRLAPSRRKGAERKRLSLNASVEPPKRSAVSLREVMEFYKPIKKPVTLRLDADVLAWFKRDGRRYQTRINAALRRVMKREMKGAE
jgi:uncharacterized protein (DUF4415 family)